MEKGREPDGCRPRIAAWVLFGSTISITATCDVCPKEQCLAQYTKKEQPTRAGVRAAKAKRKSAADRI